MEDIKDNAILNVFVTKSYGGPFLSSLIFDDFVGFFDDFLTIFKAVLTE